MIKLFEASEKTFSILQKFDEFDNKLSDEDVENLTFEQDEAMEKRMLDQFPGADERIGYDSIVVLENKNSEQQFFFLGTEQELQEWAEEKIRLAERFLKLRSFE